MAALSTLFRSSRIMSKNNNSYALFNIIVRNMSSCCNHNINSQVQINIVEDPLATARASAERDGQLLQPKPAECRLVLLGGPGVGKGTYGHLLSKRFNIPHISTGDLVRAQLTNNSTTSSTLPADIKRRELIRNTISQGKLLGDDIVLELLVERLHKLEDPKSGYILDGFPRTLNQAKLLDAINIDVDMAINFKANREALVAKCLGRRVCTHCGKDYNLAHVVQEPQLCLPSRMPPPECAGHLKTRTDDSDEKVVRERLRLFEQESLPVEQHYQQQGKLLEVDVGVGIQTAWPNLVDATLRLNTAKSAHDLINGCSTSPRTAGMDGAHEHELTSFVCK